MSLLYAEAKCIDRWDIFDGTDIEDADGNLIGEHYAYEDTAKALCADCPVFDLCERDTLEYESDPKNARTGIRFGLRPDERRKRGKK